MNYRQTLAYLDSLEQFGIHLGLFRIRYLLNTLGNPENRFRTIHIAGTNGKGSVCRMLASILKESGLRTGAYTSPHLQDFPERITIDNKKISEKELAQLATTMAQIAKKAYGHPTHFEFTTALAFQYFAEKNVDIAVIETGMGGRLDATNTILPELSIITNVELEHTKILGNTVVKIAREKAGIIKPKIPVITAAKKQALSVIKRACARNSSPLYSIRDPEEVLSKYPELELPLAGLHQRANAALAIKAAELLGVSKQAILVGIKKTKHPGRLELMQRNPRVFLDGAHNPAGMAALSQAISELEYKKLALVLAVSKDKDVPKIASLLPRADILIASQYRKPRSLGAEALAAILKKSARKPLPEPRIETSLKKSARKPLPELCIEPSLRKAARKARSLAGMKGLILITGSLYTVGEARKFWKKNVEYE